MAEGFRSPYLFWIGGLSALNPTISGWRSPYMPWLGGLCAPVEDPQQGWRSTTMFWLGGLCGQAYVPPPSIVTTGGGEPLPKDLRRPFSPGYIQTPIPVEDKKKTKTKVIAAHKEDDDQEKNYLLAMLLSDL